MCFLLFILIYSIMLAMVVDLPLPILPVKRTRPPRSIESLSKTCDGKFKSLKVWVTLFTLLITKDGQFRCINMLILNLVLSSFM
ncbi:MAG: hypothetical protein BWY16_01140 [Candidatus Omnitrophica bacterium ADurb.Bin205]|nr:MAG: hypothetical protein BWY16_01140 [Candidatus Omnitrophica bacterium ADurb.Bin205]